LDTIIRKGKVLGKVLLGVINIGQTLMSKG
jgi:hypothetical protein